MDDDDQLERRRQFVDRCVEEADARPGPDAAAIVAEATRLVDEVWQALVAYTQGDWKKQRAAAMALVMSMAAERAEPDVPRHLAPETWMGHAAHALLAGMAAVHDPRDESLPDPPTVPG